MTPDEIPSWEPFLKRIPLFAGLTPTYAGLYQVNVTIPSNAPKGTIGLSLAFNDVESNVVDIVIQ